MLHEVVLDAGLFGPRKDFLPINRVIRGNRSHLAVFISTLYMDQGKATGKAMKIRQWVGTAFDQPEDVHFHLDELGIGFFQKDVVRQLALDRFEFKGVVVIGELDSGLASLFAGAVECGNGALPAAELLP